MKGIEAFEDEFKQSVQVVWAGGGDEDVGVAVEKDNRMSSSMSQYGVCVLRDSTQITVSECVSSNIATSTPT